MPMPVWIERLGHLNESAIKHLVVNGTVAGMKILMDLFKKDFICLSCESAKRKRMSYKARQLKQAKVNYERLMADTCDMGKYLPGVENYQYFRLIQAEGSRYKWCFLLKKKSKSNGHTMQLIKQLLVQGHKIQIFTCDGGGEFVNSELQTFLVGNSIRFVPTHPFTPEDNALVERRACQ